MSPKSALQPETEKPILDIDEANLPATAFALRDLLLTSPHLFVRGVPVKLIFPSETRVPAVIPLTRARVIIEGHQQTRPVVFRKGQQIPVPLPSAVADIYLAMNGDWQLRPLAGITSSPLLAGDGTICAGEGYDPQRKLWCSSIPPMTVPDQPTGSDAKISLLTLRGAFKTFPFADARRKRDGSGVEIVDLDQPPGQDESAFLAAQLTAICRPSLDRAPGFLLKAPALSGAGTGKGMLVRAICAIAFGMEPTPFTAGENRAELDKRLVAVLVRGEPAVFLDNFNGRFLKSELMAQLLTEGPVIISRKMGATCMLPLSCVAFVAVTGNAVAISEDLARRFIVCELDAHCEHPEQRNLPEHFLVDIQRRRPELISAALTIWRWGRQNAASLTRGRPLGSFEVWSKWCRDPLLTLGARDPVERIDTIKARDPDRLSKIELFNTWYSHHTHKPVAVTDLAEPICKTFDPQNRGRQFRARYLERLVGTRIGGFVLTQQKPSGKSGRTTYAVRRTTDDAGMQATHQSEK
jgi:hypothetical protein